ncbi:beta-3 adrenergic receptor-like [Mizuhopecten yessoensis]|uniref:Octopamine receptor n=1 Tax=Mizuhopecten yessoensis TaxID=6573 RepID=A0A210QSD7_MIZYE|nr:beta-3 adrenergic receptor-like [Mizuhopecten yessoensis]OWF51634.1 Octopamine receptor [Mizuhopecten yessoensis]
MADWAVSVLHANVPYNLTYNGTFNMTTNKSDVIPDDRTFLVWRSIGMGVVMYAAVLLTICGNILVLIAVARNKRLQTVFNIYVINLAVTDLLVAVTAMSFYTTETVLGYWPFGEFLCGVWIFVDYGMTFASVFTLIAISVDRFWSVTWSLHYRAHHNKIKAVRLIVAVWVSTLLLWLPACIMDRINNSVPNKCVWEPSKNKEFVVVIATIGHHGAFTVMVVCYVKVFFTLVQRQKVGLGHTRLSDRSPTVGSPTNIRCARPGHDSPAEVSVESHVIHVDTSSDASRDTHTAKQDTSHTPSMYTKKTEPENGNKCYGIRLEPICSPVVNSATQTDGDNDCLQRQTQPDQTTNKRQRSFINRQSKKRKQRKEEAKYERHERRVFTTLTYILAGYIICWLPFHIVFDVRAAKPEAVSSIVYNLAFWLSYLNSMINPFLYNFSSSDFRTAFKQLLCKGKPTTSIK